VLPFPAEWINLVALYHRCLTEFFPALRIIDVPGEVNSSANGATCLFPPRWRVIGLIVTAAGMIAAFAVMTTLTHFTRQGVLFLRYFLVAFALYLAALLLLWKAEMASSRMVLAGVFAAALLMRVPLWFTEPSLSTDVWRYLWDGHLLNQGVSPYAERVDSPALNDLATPLRDRVEHQWMASPYPPAAQVVFGGVYALVPRSPTAFQVVFTLFDLASGWAIVLLLRHLKRPPGRVVLYLWNPLVVVEFAHSAHIDSLMILLILLALYWLLAGRRTLSAGALALAVLTKFIPALLLPVFVRRWGWWRTAAFVALVLVGFLPFAGAGTGLGPASDGTGLFGASRIYLALWQTNGGLHYWLAKALEPHLAMPNTAAKGVGALILIGVGGGVFFRTDPQRDAESVVGGAVLLIAIYLLFSATVFPWYLAWLIALLPLLPFPDDPAALVFAAGWVYFSAAVDLSYLFYLDPANPHEFEWVRRVEYWPLFALLAIAMVLKMRRHRRELSGSA
jgi:alpha-1,6-mannosyltransferase